MPGVVPNGFEEAPLVSNQKCPTEKLSRDTIKKHVFSLSQDLWKINQGIHGKPELGFEEVFACETLCSFMESQQDWKVERGICNLPTAWSATWTSKNGPGKRTIGLNSEMDALPGIGHACGHNLIAISGVAAAIGLARSIDEMGLAGKIILLGTPAEEGGAGKDLMLTRGGYTGMDACLMLHPNVVNLITSSLAYKRVWVTFHGKSAHAAANPWTGVNALDAAVLAYNNISLLRQQVEDEVRIHGIIKADPSWAHNVIPHVARLEYAVRARKRDQVNKYMERVCDCFHAAAKASACTVDVELENVSYDEIIMNNPLKNAWKDFMAEEGVQVNEMEVLTASTDFGNVSHQMPALHPLFAIHVNDPKMELPHTPHFTAYAGSEQAHEKTLLNSASLARLAALFLHDDEFAKKVEEDWKGKQL